jgi:Ca2+-binding EF-hand superfamily protein
MERTPVKARLASVTGITLLALALSAPVQAFGPFRSRNRRPSPAQAFSFLDRDRSGALEVAELADLLDPEALKARAEAEVRRRAGPMAGLFRRRMRRARPRTGQLAEMSQRMVALFDANGDGALDGPEREAAAGLLLARLDGDRDGAVSKGEFLEARERLQEHASQFRSEEGGEVDWQAMRAQALERYDRDGDGELSPAEWPTTTAAAPAPR